MSPSFLYILARFSSRVPEKLGRCRCRFHFPRECNLRANTHICRARTLPVYLSERTPNAQRVGRTQWQTNIVEIQVNATKYYHIHIKQFWFVYHTMFVATENKVYFLVIGIRIGSERYIVAIVWWCNCYISSGRLYIGQGESIITSV